MTGTCRKQNQPVGMILLIGITLLTLAGCSASEPQPEAFLPLARAATPTAAPTQAPAAEQAALPLTATPAAPCKNHLTYLEDLTLPDGTQVSPGQVLDKRWRVLNSGECNWDSSYRLEQIEGGALGSSADAALYPARGGTEAILRINLTAPAEAGTYRSLWQAVDPQGQHFGDVVYLEIIVP